MTEPSDPGRYDPGRYQYRPSDAPPPEAYPQPAPPIPGYGYAQPGTQAMAPGLHVDQASGLALPQGVELASAGRRIGAYFLAIPLSIVTLGIGYLIWGMIVWAGGQTPALQVLGMRCWRPPTGRAAGWWWMALREIIGRMVDSILGPITGLLSFILMLATPDRRTLHDMVAGTVVVYDPNKVLVRQAP